MEQPEFMDEVTEADPPAEAGSPAAEAGSAPPASGGQSAPVGWIIAAGVGLVVAVALLVTQIFLVTTLNETNDEIAALQAEVGTLRSSVDGVEQSVSDVSDQVSDIEQSPLALAPGPQSVASPDEATAPEPAPTGETSVESPPLAVTTGLPRFDGNPNQDPALGMLVGDVTGLEYYTEETVTYSPEPGITRAYFVWAHWCPYCQEEMPLINDKHGEWEEQYGHVEIVSVSTAVDETRGNPLVPYLETGQYPFPVLLDDDGALAGQFGVSAFPFWIFVGPDGEVLARVAGLLPVQDLENVFSQMNTIGAASA